MAKKTRTQTEEQPLQRGSSSTMPQREERENENETKAIVKETVKVKAGRDIYIRIYITDNEGDSEWNSTV